MPTTIYDSSLITQRRQNKIIAQQVQQRNTQGVPIIIPQAGYSAYVNEQVENGSITDYRKRDGCTNINVACKCDSSTNITPAIIPNDNIEIVHNYPPEFVSVGDLIGLQISGEGTIDWGDGTIETLTGINIDYQHSYTSSGTYTITLRGIIIFISTSRGEAYTSIQNFIDVQSMNFIDASNLTTLYSLNQSFTTITNFNTCYNSLKIITIDTTNTAYGDLIYCTSLISLEINGSTNLLNSILDIQSIWPLLNTLGLYDNTYITSVTNLPSTLIRLSLNSAISVTSLPTLPSTLTSLSLNSTGVTSLPLTLPSTLIYLSIDSTGISSLPTLPSSLTYLSIDSTGISSLPTLPSSLTYLSLNSTGVTSLPTLPSTLTSLSIDSTGVTSLPTLPSSLTSLSLNSTGVTSLPTLPNNIINIKCSFCNINQFAADAIAANLVANNQSNGKLFIQDQSGPVTLNITGGDWTTLINNGWTIQ